MSTFSQIYIHIIFAVKYRKSLIQSDWEERLYQYITGIVQNKGQKMLAINGMPDHIHFLIGMRPSCCLSDLVREIKKSSNEFIRENRFTKFNFKWQEGFGAFSYGDSQLNIIINYIMKQKEHHKRMKFREEYLGFLKHFHIDYEEQYLFKWIDYNDAEGIIHL
jgi:putative transposase